MSNGMTHRCVVCGSVIAFLGPYTGTDGDGWWIAEHDKPKEKWWHRRRRCENYHLIVAPPGQASWRAFERAGRWWK